MMSVCSLKQKAFIARSCWARHRHERRPQRSSCDRVAFLQNLYNGVEFSIARHCRYRLMHMWIESFANRINLDDTALFERAKQLAQREFNTLAHFG